MLWFQVLCRWGVRACSALGDNSAVRAFPSCKMAYPGAQEEGKRSCPEMSLCPKLLDQDYSCDLDKSQGETREAESPRVSNVLEME